MIKIHFWIDQQFGTVAIPFREMCVRCGTAEDMIDDLIVVATGLLALSKLICYHVYRDRLRPSVESAIEDWSSEQSKEFKNIMSSEERTYKSVAFALISTAAASTLLYSVKIFFTEPDRWIEAEETHAHVYYRIFNETGINGSRMVLRKRFLFPSTCTLNDVPSFVYPSVIFVQYMQVSIFLPRPS